MLKHILIATYSLLLVASIYGTAHAGNSNPYQPLNLRLGGFNLSPKVEFVNEFDSNIYRTEANEVSDHVLKIRPSLHLGSNWNRHAIDISMRGDLQYYSSRSSENKQNYFIDLAGRLDVVRDSYAIAKFYHGMNTEKRGTVEGAGQKSPVEYTTVGGFAGYEHLFNRLRVNVSNDFRHLDYDNGASNVTGGTVNNNGRDRYQNNSEIRFGYIINPNFEVFARGAYSFIDYDNSLDINGQNRDSSGWDGSAGIRLDFTGKLTGNAHIGYMSREYEDPALSSIDGLSGGLGLRWFATGLTTVSADVKRKIMETTQLGQSGFISTTAKINIDHELLRNILLNAYFQYGNRNYEGGSSQGLPSREEDIYTFGLNAKYLFTRNFYFNAGYRFETRETNIPNNDYYDHRLMLTVGAQM